MFGLNGKAKKGADVQGAQETQVKGASESAAAHVEPTEMEKRVEVALDKIRPALQMDGGDVEIVEISGNSVKLKLVGHCAGCPHARMTLQFGIERALREQIPELGEITAE